MPSALDLGLVRRALALQAPDFDALAAQARVAPTPRPLRRESERDGQPRLAATLLLMYPHNDQLHFVLTKRPDSLRTHAGQISLPGGRKEPGETFLEAALRETCEELGVCDAIDILGPLTSLYIPPSDFQVQPFVGHCTQRPAWQIDPREVEALIEAPLAILLDDARKHEGTAEYQGVPFTYHWYEVEGYRVWGATAIMLSELEWRLRTLL
jgi:8-oxo-dGTP pyrophosphatase MutT (NUDIX family)